ncbi:hypothetical protein [Bartonella sp. CB178]
MIDHKTSTKIKTPSNAAIHYNASPPLQALSTLTPNSTKKN